MAYRLLALRTRFGSGCSHLPPRFSVMLGLSAHRDLLRRAAQGEGFFLSTDSFFPDGEKAQIVGGPLTELVSTHASASVTEHFAKDGHGLVKGDLLSQISLAETRMRMAEQLLMRVDKLSMAHSVEVRAPFLNWRLAEYALSLPGNVRARRRPAKGSFEARGRRFDSGSSASSSEEGVRHRTRPMVQNVVETSSRKDLPLAISSEARSYRRPRSRIYWRSTARGIVHTTPSSGTFCALQNGGNATV